MTVSGTAGLCLAYAGAHHAPGGMLIAVAALIGATQGSMSTLVRARWTHLTRNAGQLHTAYSMEAALDEIAFMVGPVLATWLGGTVANWLPMVITATVQLVGGWTFLLQRDTEPPVGAGRTGGKVPLTGSRVLWLVFVAYGMLGIVFGAVDVSTVAFATEAGRAATAGPALLLFSLGSFLAGFVYGSRHWAGAPWQHFTLGTVLIGCGAGSFFFARSIEALAVQMFLTGLALSPTFVAAQTLVQRLVPAERVTEGFAWVATSINTGVSVGSSLAGVGLDRVGSPGGFAVTLTGALLALAVAVSAAPALRRRTA
ncbi:MFS transporter [Raineyella fluvialis]|uniref:MFS transporter n=1 Tax=Raineyella fluvialis TaxID=2662261 RepID=A0A5Q2FF22_9ACTN|nr:MFS transporter [Raineyella fluvialis]QGF23703.1 MFS transporter [Raineyella fluvialis]